jgi:hypothetical protein
MRYDAPVAVLPLTVMLTAVSARSQTAALDAAKCRAGAAAIARSFGGTVGEQTDAVVAITYSYAQEIAYFCGSMSPTPGLAVIWTSVDPSLDTLNVITEANAAFSGMPSAAVRMRLRACIDEAIKGKKADADGKAKVTLHGTQMLMQCQLYSAGPGGTVNVSPKQR